MIAVYSTIEGGSEGRTVEVDGRIGNMIGAFGYTAEMRGQYLWEPERAPREPLDRVCYIAQ